MRDRLAVAQSLQLRMLDAIERFLRTGDEVHLTGRDGLSAASTAYGREFEAMAEGRAAYFRARDPGEEEAVRVFDRRRPCRWAAQPGCR